MKTRQERTVDSVLFSRAFPVWSDDGVLSGNALEISLSKDTGLSLSFLLNSIDYLECQGVQRCDGYYLLLAPMGSFAQVGVSSLTAGEMISDALAASNLEACLRVAKQLLSPLGIDVESQLNIECVIGRLIFAETDIFGSGKAGCSSGVQVEKFYEGMAQTKSAVLFGDNLGDAFDLIEKQILELRFTFPVCDHG